MNKTKTNASTLTANYTLENSIDFLRCRDTFDADFVSGEGWFPIGINSTGYNGTFDGGGNIIQNLFIDRNSTSNIGLFGLISDPSEITNIGLVDVDVTGNDTVGGLIGGSGTYILEGGSISDSFSIGTVSGVGSVGGLIGFSADSVSDSFSIGTVFGVLRVGGLIGDTYYGSTDNSYSIGTVFGSDDRIGGLIGFDYRSSTSNSYAISTVSGDVSVGGLTGTSYRSPVTNSYAIATVSGRQWVGGFTGYLQRADLTNSYAITIANGSEVVGGLVGYSGSGTGSIINSYSLGTVTGFEYVGGLVGAVFGLTVVDSTTNTHVTCTNATAGFCGGFAGDPLPGLYLIGTNTWVNNSDSATDCVGVSGQLEGTSAVNCSVV